MKQQTLARCLKLVTLGAALCALLLFGWCVPAFGQFIVRHNPEVSHYYLPWLLFLSAASLPCFAALGLVWRLTQSLVQERPFTQTNARRLQWIARLAAGDSAFFFLGNAMLLFLNISHPGIALLSLAVVFAGIAIAVAAACLSHLIKRASGLQEQSDLTI